MSGWGRRTRSVVGRLGLALAVIMAVVGAGTAAAPKASAADTVLSSCDGADFASAVTSALAGDGVLEISCRGTITLTDPVVVETDESLTIDGNQTYGNVIGGGRVSGQLFEVLGGTLTLDNLTIEGASASGTTGSDGTAGTNGGAGGLGQAGATGQGGALYISEDSAVTVNASTFTNDLVVGGDGGNGGNGDAASCYEGGCTSEPGGAGAVGAAGAAGQGGAIYNAGTLTITDSTFDDDQATGGDGGGGGAGGGGTGQTPGPNPAAANGSDGAAGAVGGDGQGGAIYNTGSLTVTTSTFNGNQATGGYGGGGGPGGSGAEIYTLDDSGCIAAACYDVSFGNGGAGGTGGVAGDGQGGAIFSTTTFNVSGTTFSDNAAVGGLGGYGGDGGIGGCQSDEECEADIQIYGTLGPDDMGGTFGAGGDGGVGSAGGNADGGAIEGSFTGDIITATAGDGLTPNRVVAGSGGNGGENGFGSGSTALTYATNGGTGLAGSADNGTSAPPTVESVSPYAGPVAGGTTVVITGTNFTEGSTVAFQGDGFSLPAHAAVVVSATEIDATTPALPLGDGDESGAAVTDVVVTSLAGTSTPNPPYDQFDFVPVSVTGVSPNSGSVTGGAIRVTGVGFTDATELDLVPSADTVESCPSAPTEVLSPTVVDDELITVTVPPILAGTGTGTGTGTAPCTGPLDYDVVVHAGSFSSPVGSADLYSIGPAVSTVSPDSSYAFDNLPLTIQGSNLDGASAVTFTPTDQTRAQCPQLPSFTEPVNGLVFPSVVGATVTEPVDPGHCTVYPEDYYVQVLAGSVLSQISVVFSDLGDDPADYDEDGPTETITPQGSQPPSSTENDDDPVPSFPYPEASTQTSDGAPAEVTTGSENGPTVDLSIPAGALPDGTTATIYAADPATLPSPQDGEYVVGFAVSWKAPDGSVPDASSPLTLTINDPAIHDGDVVYFEDSSGQLTKATATVTNGHATITFTGDPGFLVVQPTGLSRLAGPDRIATAVAASQAELPTPASAGAVVLAGAGDEADGLAAAPLASAEDAPLLLVDPQGAALPEVETEIARVLPAGGTVYLVGGLAVLPGAIQSALAGLGYQVKRVAGTDRYATAAAVAGVIGTSIPVVLTDGATLADGAVAAAAAAHLGGALLFTDGRSVPAATDGYLTGHSPSGLWAVGGAAAAADPGAHGLVGQDRYATAAAVAANVFSTPIGAVLVSEQDPADAATAAVSAARSGWPVLLLDPAGPDTSTSGYITSEQGLTAAYLVGGTAVVPDAQATELAGLLHGAG